MEGRRKIGLFLPLSFYYFRRHTTLFSCDMHSFSNPLFGSLRMQHPWNLDTFYSRRHGNKGGKSLSEENGRGQGLLEKSYSPGGKKREFQPVTLCKVTPPASFYIPRRVAWLQRWEPSMRPGTEGLSVQPQDFCSGPLLFTSSVASYMMSLLFSEINSGSQLLQKSA